MDALSHVAAIIDTLEDAGLTVGDHKRPHSIPEDPSDASWAPYVIVYLQPGGTVNGPASAPEEDFDARFSIVSVGRVAGEAIDTGDTAYTAITAGFTVAGRSIQRVRPTDPNGYVTRDDGVTPPLFSHSRRYGFHSFPA